jgi:predicted peptidase
MLQLECQTEGSGLRYLLYLPGEYDPKEGSSWPLIFYLHGIGERGENLKRLLKHGIPKVVESRDDFPCITVSPQCPPDTFWVEHYFALKATLDEVRVKYRIDEHRIYLTGNSMGGYGTWGLAITYPDTFAAIAPICAGGQSEEVCVLKDVPVWAFHGELDDRVPLEEGQRMVDELEACGGKVRFTVYEGVGHDSWTRTYENPELFEWFLEHRRT